VSAATGGDDERVEGDDMDTDEGTGTAIPGQTVRGKQRRYLRGLGVNLDAVVFIGKEGITDAVVGELSRVLKKRELVKVRLLDNVDGDRKDVAKALAAKAEAELIQVLGRTVLLWRRNEEKPTIRLPD